MGLPYFPMFPTDFEAKTSHLTLEEDGAYNRLLRLCWMMPGCSLPDDDAWIMRRMRVSKDDYDRVVLVVLDEFFERKNGRVSNARLTEEFERSKTAHEKRVLAGSKGGHAKSLKTKETSSSNARSMPEQCSSNQNQNQIKKKINKKEKSGVVQKPESVPDQLWSDFKKVRVAKKAPLTPTAFSRIESEAKKAGCTIVQALTLMVEKNWQGFNADWVKRGDISRPKEAAPLPQGKYRIGQAVLGRDDLVRAMTVWRERQYWHLPCPPPGQPGCEIPPEFLAN